MVSARPQNHPLRPVPESVPGIQAEWGFTIWELSSYYPDGRSFEANYSGLQTVVANKDFKLRIIFAPVDVFGNTKVEKEAFSQLYRLLSVPDEFMDERKQSVSHSFGTKTTTTGTCAWFHFLCKHINITVDKEQRVRIVQDRIYEHDSTADEDYAYIKSGFIINTMRGPEGNGPLSGSTTLVSFGATPQVNDRLNKFIRSIDKELAFPQPYLFFVPVLSGLYADLDGMAWNLNDIFADHESKLLTGAYDISKFTEEDANIFATLHYLAKYCFVLIETVSSLKLVTENIRLRLGTDTSARESPPTLPDTNPLESIRYTQALLESTHLRLNTLRLRIKNAINLAFNLGADKDTKTMMEDSHVMKVIGVMTAFLLPATALSSVLGSNMFASNNQEAWKMNVNASFWVWCVVAFPITLCLVAWLFVKYIKKGLRFEFLRRRRKKAQQGRV